MYPLFSVYRRGTRGVALVIVLAFVVLLSGLVLAFFSRALSERLISNSSANAVRVDIFAQDAVATTLGDLRQEITAGSSLATPTPAPSPIPYAYKPRAAAAAVPCPVGIATADLPKMPNLVKRSAYDYTNNRPYPFYANPSALPSPSPAPSPYDTTNYPPSARAAKSSSISSSLNGRTISPSRWNKALLLPKKDPGTTNDSDFTPVGATAPKNGAAAVWSGAPDWIVVARDGTNPSSWNTALTNNGSNPVLGRYAYNIYNEGGLLDMNAAGYPPDVANDLSSIPQGRDPGYKSSLAFADLTTLPGFATGATDALSNPIAGVGLDRAKQVIKTLVGWRNYASTGIDLTASAPAAGLPVSGSVNVAPGYSWTGGTRPGSNELNYLNMLRLTNLGFLSPANRLVVNKQSDRAFASRQQLMNLLLNSIADQTSNGTAERAALQNSLQYLGTFSRSLNQPSYFPVLRAFNLKTNYYPRPTILPYTNITDPTRGGGNNVGYDYASAGAQDAFNPYLLTIRAESSTFNRNDGVTPAVTGEPLIKTRFALQRLAWLTYAGPSALRTVPSSDPGVDTPDYDVWQLVNNYGISRSYLAQGTVANIQRYFGLEWDGSKKRWLYDLHNRNGSPAGTTPNTTGGAIRQLQEIADLKTREPDFFELIKSSIDPASLGKASIASSTVDISEGADTTGKGYGWAPLNFQFLRDISYDAAIIQLGANIIDQFDADGYPTRIVFNDGSKGPREFRGIENLPYIYRVRSGILRVREPIPEGQGNSAGAGKRNAGSGDPANDGCYPERHSGAVDPADEGNYPVRPLKDTGVGLLLAVPDIWNPHDQNSSLGSPRPGLTAGSFRVLVSSATPDGVDSGTGYSTLTVGGGGLSDTNQGRYKGSSFQAVGNGGGGSEPAGSVPSPQPPPGYDAPVPYFSRVPTPNGGASSNPMTGGYNNPQVITSVPLLNMLPPVSTATSSILSFGIPNAALFREPTLLGKPDTTSGSGLSMSITNPDVIQLVGDSGNVWTGTGLQVSTSPNNPGTNPLAQPTSPATNQPYIGLYLGAFPLRWVGSRWSGGPFFHALPPPAPPAPNAVTFWVYTDRFPAVQGGPAASMTYTLQCQDASGNWISYDQKYVNTEVYPQWVPGGLLLDTFANSYTFADPRTSRFGAPDEKYIAYDAAHTHAPTSSVLWLDNTTAVISIERPDIHAGFGANLRGVYGAPSTTDWAATAAAGWHYKNVYLAGQANVIYPESGLLAQNDPTYVSDGVRFQTDAGVGASDPQFYSDSDGVVRRATGGSITSKTSMIGQPLATASIYTSGKAAATSQSASRPKMLNRPFRSVAELGYVFSGTPWKNLDFSTPESGYSELLDVFCVNENDDPSGLVAGKVDLNTRQVPVLTALLANTSLYESGPSVTPQSLGATDAAAVAVLLVKRTSIGTPSAPSSPQPLTNLGDLVGRWTNKVALTGSFTPALYTSHNTDGSKSYDGFTADISSLTANPVVITPIEAQRETAVRALASVGNTRVWNLLIDVIAQTGRYPSSATSLDNFSVEGEQRCWLHVAIDRATGQVVDSKLEIVKE